MTAQQIVEQPVTKRRRISTACARIYGAGCGTRNHSKSSNRPCLCGVADSHISPIITEHCRAWGSEDQKQRRQGLTRNARKRQVIEKALRGRQRNAYCSLNAPSVRSNPRFPPPRISHATVVSKVGFGRESCSADGEPTRKLGSRDDLPSRIARYNLDANRTLCEEGIAAVCVKSKRTKPRTACCDNVFLKRTGVSGCAKSDLDTEAVRFN